MPPITPCTVRAGSKIKSVSAIPGRGPDDSVMQQSSPSMQNVSQANIQMIPYLSMCTCPLWAVLKVITLHNTGWANTL